jgi:hypothetical protein
MEREDERGVAKRPDLNELDVPEWAELALDKVERRKRSQRITLWRWRQRAAGRAQRLGCGVRLGARSFSLGVQLTQDVHHAGLEYRQGRRPTARPGASKGC